MSNKKILFVAPRFHTNQFFLTKNLIQRGVDVNFLAVYIGGSENHKYLTPKLSNPSRLIKWYLKGFTAVSAEGRAKLRYYNITSFAQCYKLYKELKPDIIIVRNLRFFTSIQHLILGKLLGKKIFLYTLYGLRQNLNTVRKLVYRTLGFFKIKHYTSVIGEEIHPIVPNTIYIPMIFDPLIEENEIFKRNEHAGIHIITVGKMQKRKNLNEFLLSLYRINFFADSNNRLVIISECISEENFKLLEILKTTISDGEFSSQIDLRLNVKHDEVFKQLKSSDLFVMPSHNEPAGTSMVEAMACGLPVICSDSNGAKCYVKQNKNGYVFKYTNEFQYLDIVLKEALNKEKLQKLGLESLNIIKEDHSIERFYKAVVMM